MGWEYHLNCFRDKQHCEKDKKVHQEIFWLQLLPYTIQPKKHLWTLNTTIISALSHTYVVSGAANSCCADICWGNNLVSRLWLGFFAWKATTLALIHLWRVPLLSLHKSKEKTTQIFSLALANFQSPRRGSEKLWGSIGSAPDYRWNPGGHFAGALKWISKLSLAWTAFPPLPA